jgi:hypothetical protein
MKPKFERKPPTNWKKIGVVVIGVLFIVLMVVSTLGTGWLSSFASVKAGNTVALDFTVRDIMGRPVVTTSQQVFNDATANGWFMYFTKPIQITANSTANDVFIRMPCFEPGKGWVTEFALFAPEYNLISGAVIGMKKGQTTALTLPMYSQLRMVQNISDVGKMGVNASLINVGDQVRMAVASTPVGTQNVTAPETYAVRTATVVQKSNETIELYSGYSTIEIGILDLKG